MPMSGCNDPGPTEIECRQIAELLSDYLDGTLPGRTRELIDFHIDGCPPCVAFINTYRGTIEAARNLAETPIPPELKKRLVAVLKSDRAPQRPA
jgi:predicted anti-sigma-YlaC factor YlaD